MEPLAPTMELLFAQLGESYGAADIVRFIAQHSPMAGQLALHEAPFWTPAQAAFLRDAIAQDADWAPVVDALNAGLHDTTLTPSTLLALNQK